MDKLTLLIGYAAVIYVDRLGDDTTGNGTEANPYKTILKASQSVTMDNTMIHVAREGTYEEKGLYEILNLKYTVTFSTVTVTDSSKEVYLHLSTMSNFVPTSSVENIFIGFIIRRLTTGTAFMYFINGTIPVNISFNNCVFDSIPYSPTAFPISNAPSGSIINYNNCTLTSPNYSGTNNTGSSKGNFTSCAIADTNLTTTTGNVLSATFDSEFRLTSSTAQVGVYSGAYAWTYVAKPQGNTANLLIGYADIKYVDGLIGNDTTGNGTKLNPYKTILKASQSVIIDDTMIHVAREGVYEEEKLQDILNLKYKVTFSTVTVTDYTKTVYLLLNSAPSTTTIMTYENRFIGFIMQRNPIADDLRTYAYFHNTSRINLSFHNCVFDDKPNNPTGFPIFAGQNSTGATVFKMDYVNCSFLPASFSYTRAEQGLSAGRFVSCAIADSNLTSEVGNILSAKFDLEYSLISSSGKVGVYEGAYAWNSYHLKTLINNNGKYKKYINGQWIDVSTTSPTEQEFITHGMPLPTVKSFKRELVTQSNVMVSQGTLGSGKLFKSSINLDKYFNIKSIEIK